MAVVLMGVSGCGKTLIGSRLASSAGAGFVEGDRHHPSGNVDRMARGLPLRDEDRWAWLDSIAAEIARAGRQGSLLVVACSALKRRYRDRLRAAGTPILFIHLEVDQATAAARVSSRRNHFMPASLIDSQFADLEPPEPDELAVGLDATQDPDALVAQAMAALTAIPKHEGTAACME
jgi:gluconokinase